MNAHHRPASQRVAVQAETALMEIADFATGAEFQAVLAELWALPSETRAQFVLDVILQPNEMSRRGVFPPPGIQLQRSWFADNRPTLFCITKYLPRGLLWDKVTITYDNPDGVPAVRYEDVVGAESS